MLLRNLKDLYVSELRDLYDGETQLEDALERMRPRVRSAKLHDFFQEHRTETAMQRKRLVEIFNDLDEDAGGELCDFVEGLVLDAEELLERDGDPATIDAAVMGIVSRIEHYEIAGYRAAWIHAEMLGFDDHASLLQETLDEEQAAAGRIDVLSREVNLTAVRLSA